MIVQGVEVTEAQQVAGRAAMRGAFMASDVRRALMQAGVNAGRPEDYFVERVADRLMQQARKKGEIKATNRRWWRAVAE